MMSLVAYADAKHYWEKNTHLSVANLAKAAQDIGKSAFDLWIGDDIKTLQSADASDLQRLIAEAR
jgi:hypothetical protein